MDYLARKRVVAKIPRIAILAFGSKRNGWFVPPPPPHLYVTL